MKVWRVITLCLWGIFLTGFIVVSSFYFLLNFSILNQAKMKQALAANNFYQSLRDEQIIPALIAKTSITPTEAGVLPRKDITAALKQVFPAARVETMSNSVIDVIYQWLDKKRPDMSFTIDLSQEKQQLINVLSTTIDQNAEKLPDCESGQDVADDPTLLTCLPPFVQASDVATAAKEEMKRVIDQTEASLTNEDVALTNRTIGDIRNVPDYLSYLWTLNLITLPLAALSTLYLILRRKGGGLIVVGGALAITGILAIIGYAVTQSRLLYWPGATFDTLLTAARSLVRPMLLLFGGIGIGVGVLLIALGIVWVYQRRKHLKRKALAND